MGIIDNTIYSRKREELREKFASIPKKKSEGFALPDALYTSRYGKLVPKVILMSYFANKISFYDAVQYCKLAPKWVSKLEGRLFR